MISTEIINGINRHMDLHNLAVYLSEKIHQQFLRPVALYLLDEGRGGFVLEAEKGTEPKVAHPGSNSALFHHFPSQTSYLLVEAENCFNKENDNSKSSQKPEEMVCLELKKMKVSICLALRPENSSLFGLLTLGWKEPEQVYTEEEIRDLLAIAHQASFTIEMIKRYAHLVQERLYANLGKMTFQVADDLHTPLNNINMFLQLLSRDPNWKKEGEPDLVHKFFPIAQEEMKRVVSMIKSLLMYARPSKMKTDQIALHQLMDKVLASLSKSLEKNAVQIIRCYQPEEITIPGQYDQLLKVFTILFHHGVEAMKGESLRQLTIRTEKDDYWVKIFLTDTGRGIPEIIKAEPSKPLGLRGREDDLLGLSMVERFMALHGGTIQVKADYGCGNNLMITLPLEKRRAERRLAFSLEVVRLPQNETFKVEDISTTGLRLSSREHPPYDQPVRLFINLPDGLPPVPVLGQVVWIKEVLSRPGLPYDFGLEYIDLGEKSRQRIQEWINSSTLDML